MEYFTLNLKKLDGAKLHHGGCVECVDGKYYICSDAGHKHGVVYAMDGDVCSRPANTLFTLLTEDNRYIYLTGQEFKLACIPVKKEQGLQASEELPDEKPTENLLEEKASEGPPEDPRIVCTRIETIDEFLKALLNSGFDSGIGYGCDRDTWFDYGVEAVKERAEVIAKEMKESLLQRVSDKEEEVER